MAKRKEIFKLEKEHIKLVRRMDIFWSDRDTSGAPFVDTYRPYGNSDYLGDIGEILDLIPDKSSEEGLWSDDQIEYMKEIHKETRTAMQIILRTGKFKPGYYAGDGPFDWELTNIEL